MQHEGCMMPVSWLSKAQGMVVRVGQHRIGNHDKVVVWVGDAGCFALANFENLVVHRP